MYDIRIIKDPSKYEIIKNIPYNCIYNRFDIVWFDDFDIIEVSDSDVKFYIPIHIENFKTCYLASFMQNMKNDMFNSVIQFIFDCYKYINTIEIWHGLNTYNNLRETNNYILNLPNSVEEYNKNFSSKTRYNRRHAIKKLEENFKTEFKYFQRKDFTEELLSSFLKFKNIEDAQAGTSVYYSNDYKKLLGSVYYLTDIWALYINNEIAATILYSSTNGTDYWCENMAYDIAYRHYGIGNILFYHSIEEIIKRHGSLIILGGGGYEYKSNCKAVDTLTYTGYIKTKTPLVAKLYRITLKIYSKYKKTDRYMNTQTSITTILGLKFKKQRKFQI